MTRKTRYIVLCAAFAVRIINHNKCYISAAKNFIATRTCEYFVALHKAEYNFKSNLIILFNFNSIFSTTRCTCIIQFKYNWRVQCTLRELTSTLLCASKVFIFNLTAGDLLWGNLLECIYLKIFEFQQLPTDSHNASAAPYVCTFSAVA